MKGENIWRKQKKNRSKTSFFIIRTKIELMQAEQYFREKKMREKEAEKQMEQEFRQIMLQKFAEDEKLE